MKSEKNQNCSATNMCMGGRGEERMGSGKWCGVYVCMCDCV